MSLEKLREDLKAKETDTFEVGTVLRWKAAERYNYAAIKTSVGWYTTATSGNRFVEPGPVDYEDLVEYLAENGVTDIQVASEWESV